MRTCWPACTPPTDRSSGRADQDPALNWADLARYAASLPGGTAVRIVS